MMLYFLTSPFHHAYMQQGKNSRLGISTWAKTSTIYGNTKNGKTYLLQYCSRLLTGSNKVTAYDDDFSATKVKNY